jgi:TonB family protein
MNTQKLVILFLALITFSCSNQSAKKPAANRTDTTNLLKTTDIKAESDNKTETLSTDSHLQVKDKQAPELNAQRDESVDLAKFYKQFDKPVQLFKMKTNIDTTLICNEGTTLSVKANSFVTESGKPVTGDIQIQVKEYYKLSDILLNNLSTTSNNDPLETAGIIYIEAISNGEQCKLVEDSSIAIGFPYSEKKEGMKLFTGQRDGNSRMNWNEAPLIQKVQLVPTKNSNGKEKVEPFLVVEQMPDFPSGETALNKYLDDNLIYPYTAMINGIEGTVYIRFVVEKTGEITNVAILRGVNPELDKASIFIVSNMPKWTPGRQNGTSVPVYFTLPIHFTLNNKNEKPSEEAIQKSKDFEKKIEKIQVVNADSGSKINVEEIAEESEKNMTDENLNEAVASQISRYIFSAFQLGWINCDRFIREDTPKIDLIVNLGSNTKKSDLKLVFNDYNIILAGSLINDKYIIKSLPIGSRVTLVAIKFENEQYYLAIKPTQISRGTEPELIFEPVTMETLKTALEKLSKI